MKSLKDRIRVALLGHLEKYVDGIDAEQFQLCWSGQVTLNNLKLKPLAWQMLSLPLRLVQGRVQRVDLKLPWPLFNTPVVIEMSGIHALADVDEQVATTVESQEAMLERLQQIALLAKRNELKASESMLKQSISEEETKQRGVVEAMIFKIMRNLRLVLKDVHVRVESQLVKTNPFAMGFLLRELSTTTTDESGKEVFITRDHVQQHLYKRLLVKEFVVFWDPAPAMLCNGDLSKLAQMRYDQTSLVPPFSLSATLKMNERRDFKSPAYTLNAVLNNLTLSLTAEQYESIMRTVEYVSFSLRRNSVAEKYAIIAKHKPDRPVRTDPRSWWRFAIQSVNCLRTGSVRLDAEERRRIHHRLRRTYLPLYKNVLLGLSLSQVEKVQLDAIEGEAAVDDIAWFRSLASAEVRREQQQQRLHQEPTKRQSTAKGYFSSLLMKLGRSGSQQEEVKEDPAQDASDLDELYEALDYQSIAQQGTTPREAVWLHVTLSLNNFRVNLKETATTSFVYTTASGTLTYLQRFVNQSSELTFDLAEFACVNTMPQPVFKTVSAVTVSEPSLPAMRVSLMIRPPERKAEHTLCVSLGSMSFIYDQALMSCFRKFFQVRSSSSHNLQALGASWAEEQRARFVDFASQHQAFELSITCHNLSVAVPLALKLSNNEASPTSVLTVHGFELASQSQVPTAVCRRFASVCSSLSLKEQCDNFRLDLHDLTLSFYPSFPATSLEATLNGTYHLPEPPPSQNIISDWGMTAWLHIVDYKAQRLSIEQGHWVSRAYLTSELKALHVSVKQSQLEVFYRFLFSPTLTAEPVDDRRTVDMEAQLLDDMDETYQELVQQNQEHLSRSEVFSSQFVGHILVGGFTACLETVHDRGPQEAPLVTLTSSHMVQQLTVNPQGWKLESSLSGVVVEDERHSSAGLRYLVRPGSTENSDHRDFITVVLSQHAEQCPHLGVAMSACDVTWNPETVMFLYETLNGVLSSTHSVSSKDDEGVSFTDQDPKPFIQVDVDLKALNVGFTKETTKKCLYRLRLDNASAKYTGWTNTDFRVKTQVDSLVLTDNTASADGGTSALIRPLAAADAPRPRDAHVLDVTFQRTKDAHSQVQSYDINIALQSVECLYIQQVVMELSDYFTAGVLGVLVVRTINSAQELTVSQTKTEITLHNPRILIPSRGRLNEAKTAAGTMACDLGIIRVTNSSDRTAQERKLMATLPEHEAQGLLFRDMYMVSATDIAAHHVFPDGSVAVVFDDVSLDCQVEIHSNTTPEACAATPPPDQTVMRYVIKSHLSPVHMCLRQATYVLLHRILTYNIQDTPAQPVESAPIVSSPSAEHKDGLVVFSYDNAPTASSSLCMDFKWDVLDIDLVEHRAHVPFATLHANDFVARFDSGHDTRFRATMQGLWLKAERVEVANTRTVKGDQAFSFRMCQSDDSSPFEREFTMTGMSFVLVPDLMQRLCLYFLEGLQSPSAPEAVQEAPVQHWGLIKVRVQNVTALISESTAPETLCLSMRLDGDVKHSVTVFTDDPTCRTLTRHTVLDLRRFGIYVCRFGNPLLSYNYLLRPMTVHSSLTEVQQMSSGSEPRLLASKRNIIVRGETAEITVCRPWVGLLSTLLTSAERLSERITSALAAHSTKSPRTTSTPLLEGCVPVGEAVRQFRAQPLQYESKAYEEAQSGAAGPDVTTITVLEVDKVICVALSMWRQRPTPLLSASVSQLSVSLHTTPDVTTVDARGALMLGHYWKQLQKPLPVISKPCEFQMTYSRQHTEQLRALLSHPYDASGDAHQALVPVASYRLIWKNKNPRIGACSVWRPVVPDSSHYVFGDVLVQGTEKPSLVSVVAMSTHSSAKRMMALPETYMLIVRSHDAAVWYPVPPRGYVSLGCILTRTASEKPSRKAVVCVHKSLVSETHALPSVRMPEVELLSVDNSANSFLPGTNNVKAWKIKKPKHINAILRAHQRGCDEARNNLNLICSSVDANISRDLLEDVLQSDWLQGTKVADSVQGTFDSHLSFGNTVTVVNRTGGTVLLEWPPESAEASANDVVIVEDGDEVMVNCKHIYCNTDLRIQLHGRRLIGVVDQSVRFSGLQFADEAESKDYVAVGDSYIEHHHQFLCFRSPHGLTNNLQVPLEVMTLRSATSTVVQSVQPGQRLWLPVPSVPGQTNRAFRLRPPDGQWCEAVYLEQFRSNCKKMIACAVSNAAAATHFLFYAVLSLKSAVAADAPPSSIRTVTDFDFNLCPQCLIENGFPVAMHLKVSWKGTVTWEGLIDSGDEVVLTSAPLTEASFVFQVLEHVVSPVVTAREMIQRGEVYIMLTRSDNPNAVAPVMCTMDRSRPGPGGCKRIAIFSECWVVNSSGLPLSYQRARAKSHGRAWPVIPFAGSCQHAPAHPQVVLFGFARKSSQLQGCTDAFYVMASHAPTHARGPIQVKVESRDGTLTLPTGDSQYDVAVHVDSLPGQLANTKVFNIKPRYVIKSQLETALAVSEYAEGADLSSIRAEPRTAAPFYFQSQSNQRYLRLGMADRQEQPFTLSGPFSVDRMATFPVKLLSKDNDMVVVLVTVARVRAQTLITVSYEQPSQPTYRIENYSGHSITYCQKPSQAGGLKDPSVTLEHGCRRVYAWNEPHAPKRALMLQVADMAPLPVYLDDKFFHFIHSVAKEPGPPEHIHVVVTNDGGSKVLRVLNPLLHEQASSAVLQATCRSLLTRSMFRVRAELSHCAVAVEDTENNNFVLLRFGQFECLLLETYLQRQLAASIASLEMSDVSVQPPHVVAKADQNEDQKAVQVLLSWPKKQRLSHEWTFNAARVAFRPLHVNTDQTFVDRLMFVLNSHEAFVSSPGMTTGVSARRNAAEVIASLYQVAGSGEAAEAPGSGSQHQATLVFRQLLISSLPLRLTFRFSNQGTGHRSFTQKLLGGLALNVNNVSIHLKGLQASGLRTTAGKLGELLVDRYKMDVQDHALELAGSSSILGNPLGIIKGVADGLGDIAAHGVVDGTSQLAMNVTRDVSASVSGVTGTLGGVFALASLDKEYQQKRSARHAKEEKKIGGVFTGSAKAATNIGRGLVEGVSGVFTKPVQGAKKGGFFGMVKGLGKGIAGLATKPVAGVLDGVGSLTDGVQKSIQKRTDSRQRKREERRRQGK